MTEAEPKPAQSPLPGSPEKEEPVAVSQPAGASHDETSKERLIFSGEEFFLTSDPDIEVLDDENNTTFVSVSKAITDNGGVIKNELSCASNVIISPLNKISIQDYEDKRVFGSQYIEDSIALKKRLPDKSSYFHPLLSRCFERCVVTCDSSIDSETEAKLRQYVELMGGIFETYSIPHEAKYFICVSSLSLKFQVAAQRSLEIAGPEWVIDSFKVFKRLPTEKYIMPPLKGCVVGTLGFNEKSKSEIKQIVTSMGGTFSDELKSLTHIITSVSLEYDDYAKYKSSQKLKNHVVTLEWLMDSVNANSGLSTAQYISRIEDPGTRVFPKRKDAAPSYLEPPSKIPKDSAGDNSKTDTKDSTSERNGEEKKAEGEDNFKKPKKDGNDGNGDSSESK